MLTYFFPQGLDGTATKPKPSAPRAHSHQCHLWSPKRHPRPCKSGMSHGLQATAGTGYHKGAAVVFLRHSFSSFSTEKSYKTEAGGCPLAKGEGRRAPPQLWLIPATGRGARGYKLAWGGTCVFPPCGYRPLLPPRPTAGAPAQGRLLQPQVGGGNEDSGGWGVWLSPGGAGLTRGCPPRGAGGRGEKLVPASA